jgi:hypothetical protein
VLLLSTTSVCICTIECAVSVMSCHVHVLWLVGHRKSVCLRTRAPRVTCNSIHPCRRGCLTLIIFYLIFLFFLSTTTLGDGTLVGCSCAFSTLGRRQYCIALPIFKVNDDVLSCYVISIGNLYCTTDQFSLVILFLNHLSLLLFSRCGSIP